MSHVTINILAFESKLRLVHYINMLSNVRFSCFSSFGLLLQMYKEMLSALCSAQHNNKGLRIKGNVNIKLPSQTTKIIKHTHGSCAYHTLQLEYFM